MFPCKESGDDCDPGPSGSAQAEGGDERDEAGEHPNVEDAGDPEGSADAEALGDAMEAAFDVEGVVLAGIDDVEAGGPEGDGGGEPENARVERTLHGDPCGGGGNAEREAEHQVREVREAFGVAVEHHDGEGERREFQAQRVEGGGGGEEDEGPEGDEAPGEFRREQAGRQVAGFGAGVAGIDVGVEDSVERHRDGAGGDHGDDDEEKFREESLAGEVGLTPGEKGSGEREGEGEDGVLELDHVERVTDACEESGQTSILAGE